MKLKTCLCQYLKLKTLEIVTSLMITSGSGNEDPFIENICHDMRVRPSYV